MQVVITYGNSIWSRVLHLTELKQFTRSIDDVKRYFSDIVGREFVEC